MSDDPAAAITAITATATTAVTAARAPLSGGCLCARVRYEATPTHRDGYYCHCRMCQLAFGNTRASFINLRKDEVRWLAAEPAYYTSSTFARRGFCRHCGTPLSFEYLDSPLMDLSIGSLDQPEAVRPCSHFAVETRIATWHADDGLPAERLDEHQRLMALWRQHYGGNATPGVDTVRAAAAPSAARAEAAAPNSPSDGPA